MSTADHICVTLFGAAGEVTGSAYHIAAPRAKVLVDFGVFQGGKQAERKNRVPVGFKARDLDAVLLTHAHNDHIGRLPLLYKTGYRGPIYATPATIEMTGLILRDSVRVQAQDLERVNRKRLRAGQDELPPLFTPDEVENTLTLLRPVPYNQPVNVAPGVQATFVEAGHMLGSTSILLEVEAGHTHGSSGGRRAIAFSGDLGPHGAPQLRDFETFSRADVAFMESTYGDRNHRPFHETVDEFTRIIKAAVARRGKVLIPTFAVGRAQVITLLLGYMFRHKIVERFPVYLDSPMAIDAWHIWRGHTELFDAETLHFLRNGSLEHDLASLEALPTAVDSMRLNHIEGPCLVMAGSGMCNGGRILHHLRNNLWKPSTSVVIVGYQSEGTIGRKLVDGEKRIKIFGEKIAVAASIHTLNGFSAHAGQSDLLKWLAPMMQAGDKPQIVLTHGEARARQPLAEQIRQLYGVAPILPSYRDTIEVLPTGGHRTLSL